MLSKKLEAGSHKRRVAPIPPPPPFSLKPDQQRDTVTWIDGLIKLYFILVIAYLANDSAHMIRKPLQSNLMHISATAANEHRSYTFDNQPRPYKRPKTTRAPQQHITAQRLARRYMRALR